MTDLHAILFWCLAILTSVCAIGVVVTQNIVRSATWLLFTLAGTSGVFFLLGADFVGATQLLVYVGGTLVLVVFGVMLTAQGPFINLKTGAAEWAFSTIVGFLLFGVIAVAIASWSPHLKTEPHDLEGPVNSMNSVVLGEAMLGFNEATPSGFISGLPANVTAIRRKQVSYLLPFEIVSIHLLVVLLGAAYLARAKRRRGVVSA